MQRRCIYASRNFLAGANVVCTVRIAVKRVRIAKADCRITEVSLVDMEITSVYAYSTVPNLNKPVY